MFFRQLSYFISYWLLFGSYCLLLVPIASSWLLLAPIGSYCLLLSPIASSLLLLSPIGSYWLRLLLLSPIGSYWFPFAPIGSYWPCTLQKKKARFPFIC